MLLALMLFAAVQDSPAAQPTPTPAKPQKICRVVESTSTRMGSGRKCKTAEEWAKDTGGSQHITQGSKGDNYDASRPND